jgi:tetratricopeptide (TPR) repeat protein
MADKAELALCIYKLAREALEHGRTSEAVDLLRSSLLLSPHFKTLELLGETLVTLKADTDAMLYLAAAVGLTSKQPRARFLLAELLSAQGDHEQALHLLDEALTINPTYNAASELRARLQRNKTADFE